MKVIVTPSYKDSCEYAASRIIDQVKDDPTSKLGLATGGTAQNVYPCILEKYKKEGLDFSKITTVNLDEYIGISSDSQASYRKNMNDWLFDHINVDKANTYVANGLNDPQEEIKTFNQKLYGDKPIDLQLLGVGVSGHIGFNESSDVLYSGVHVEKLDASTVGANARYFDRAEDVPKTAITMGVGDILKAKSIVLIATGDSKVEVIRELLTNDGITTRVPVTLLKLHPDATVVIDEELSKKIGYTN